MDTKKLTILLVAVIVIIAAVAAVAFTMGGDDENEKDVDPVTPVTPDESDEVKQYPITDKSMGELVVYGNANNDLTIDSKDVQYVKDVMSGKAPRTVFSDANHDGKVDKKDVKQIQDMIAQKPKTTVWYIDASETEKSLNWPVDRVVALSNSPQIMALSVGLDKKVVGISKQDKFLYQNFTNAKLTDAGLQDYEVMFSLKPNVVITGVGEDKNAEIEIQKTYANRGIAIFNTYNMDGDKSASSALTLGYVCQSYDKAKEYYDWSVEINDIIAKKIASIPENKRTKGMIIFGGSGVAGNGHEYTRAFETAGGINIVTDYDGYKRYSGNVTFVFNYKPDIMFRISSIGYGNIVENPNAGIPIYGGYYDIFKPMQAVQDGKMYVIDFSIPQTLRIAYMAEIMYPDLFGVGFGDEWHQKLIDIYGIDFKVDGQFVVTYDEYMASKS